ncbi:hypothetical protein K439DRAFT_1308758, partial [Ramaria rubella]
DIITIQELHINFLGNSISSPYWYPIYPKPHYTNNSSTCSLILITDSWEIIDINLADITAIQLKTHIGNIILFNIY